MAQLFISCDDAVFCEELCNSIRAVGDVAVCCHSCDGAEVVQEAMSFRPDLVILEVPQPTPQVAAIAQSLKVNIPEAPLFLVTEQNSWQTEKEALSHGIDAVFEKGEDYPALVKNLRAACGREP